MGVVLALTAGGMFLTTTGQAQGANTKLHPNDAFVGIVNSDTIKVVCPGPGGHTGHPSSGQTVGLVVPVDPFPGAGNTGSRGGWVAVQFGTSSSPVVLRHFGTAPIPTTLLLPCSGTAPVVFAPQPFSPTARDSTVTVTYANVAATPLATRNSRTITVNYGDSGKSYLFHRHDQLVVNLTEPSGLTWTEPTSSNQEVLERQSGSSGTTASASFVAVRKGKVQVTAMGSFNCLPPCLPPIILFEVNITIRL